MEIKLPSPAGKYSAIYNYQIEVDKAGKTCQKATFDISKFSLIVRLKGHKQKKSINMAIQFPLFVSSKPHCQAEY